MTDERPAQTGRPPAYAAAGVDIDAAEALVSRFAKIAAAARRPEVLADIGPFAGLFKLGEYSDPVLVASTDGVGTKLKIAALLDRHEGLGHDLVNQSVNDVLCTGAEPIFFLDYIGSFGLDDEAKVAIVRGVADACREAGCALLGGETADMPGLYAPGDFDLVGFVVGVVERDAVIDGSRIAEGDILLALPSSGLHTNGYSLVRAVFEVGVGGDQQAERERLESNLPGLEGTLGDALLVPHRSYWNDLRPLLERQAAGGRMGGAGEARWSIANFQSPIKGIAHITQGGIPGNVPRILPSGLGARIDRDSWRVPALFRLIQERGAIDEEEMFRAFNMGVGLVLIVSREEAASVRTQLPEAWVIGEVVPGKGVQWA